MNQCYHNAQIILICFSLISPPSFQSVEQKWIKEIRQMNPNVPILLVGTKLDLRENEKIIERLKERNLHPISNTEGKILEKKKQKLNLFFKKDWNVAKKLLLWDILRFQFLKTSNQ